MSRFVGSSVDKGQKFEPMPVGHVYSFSRAVPRYHKLDGFVEQRKWILSQVQSPETQI